MLGEKRHFIVAEGVPGRVCGFVSYGQSYTRDTWGEVMQLYVHPVWQRQGLGSQLLNGATRSMEACEWAIGGLHVWCTKGNAANSVYERNGWVTTGREKEIKPTLSSVIVPVVEYISPNAALELEVLREMREQKSGIDPVFKAGLPHRKRVRRERLGLGLSTREVAVVDQIWRWGQLGGALVLVGSIKSTRSAAGPSSMLIGSEFVCILISFEHNSFGFDESSVGLDQLGEGVDENSS